ncbi:hypothetical protein HH212_15050 [Massilia forsythiae]|uniref:Uncharacterized protein n=1 Tax=Massilia forsythiae TaxID=2728020 RepID=A0A7Z2VXS8_9BURK|nr:hypothetical protein [Massilia forsythiae]QJE01189.1 hypothetical protein HH212_15050 [Massilia forsythiae]
MGTANSQLVSRLAALEVAHNEWCAATDEFHCYIRSMKKGATGSSHVFETLRDILDAKYERYRELARMLMAQH